MAEKFFKVQAALLYDARPPVPMEGVFKWFEAWAKDKGLPGPFRILKGATNEDMLGIAGAGIHAMVYFSDKPCAADEFSLALKAPILKYKAFDFRAALRDHSASVIINVGDGEVPLNSENLELMSQAGIGHPADPIMKLAVLHCLMQSLASMKPPMMVNFSPSQSLISPQEMQAVAEMPLPYPILFHPFPFSNGKTKDGQPRIGMAAIHAALLIGAELELENIPKDMPIATRINLLATLIKNKRSGSLPLADGDRLQPDGAYNLTVRHEPGSSDDGPHRIVVTFDDTDAQAAASESRKGQQAFQDRIARLKERGVQAGDLSLPPATASLDGSESADDLRARVQETISPGGYSPASSGFLGGPIKLVVIAASIGLFFVLGPTDDVAEMATSQVTSFSSMMKTLSASEVVATDGGATEVPRGLESNFRSVPAP